jgi:DNA polymerase ligase (LigD)-like protein
MDEPVKRRDHHRHPIVCRRSIPGKNPPPFVRPHNGSDMSNLQKYREKRKSASTPEPMNDSKTEDGTNPIFVIQEHDASTRQRDFRPQVDGVLKSWAVPKGPSTDPRENASGSGDSFGSFQGAGGGRPW